MMNNRPRLKIQVSKDQWTDTKYYVGGLQVTKKQFAEEVTRRNDEDIGQDKI